MPKFRLPRLPRLTGWALIALSLVALTWLAEPTRLPSVAAKLANIVLAGVVAYWFDRGVFYYARPDRYMGQYGRDGDVERPCQELFIAACQRRATIIGAAMLAVALGV